MSTIQDLFQQAQLAEAAYANFLSNSGVLLTSNADVISALVANKFSSAQATAFVQHWRVVDHLRNQASGFSATVFESLDHPGQYVFAARGTEPDTLPDLSADIFGIGGQGIALRQALDLYNYRKSLGTAAGLPYQAAYLKIDLTETALLGPLWLASRLPGPGLMAYNAYKAMLESRGYWVEGATASTLALGSSATVLAGTDLAAGKNISLGSAYDVVGHSLGGHLAMVLGRLDGANVASVETFNPPFFDPFISVKLSEQFFSQLRQLEGGGSGISTTFKTSQNYAVSGDLVHLIGARQPGVANPIFSEAENTNPVSAHSIKATTDALAVYALLAQLDPSLNSNSLGTIANLLRASSSVSANSLESVLATVGKLYGKAYRAIETDRDDLYKHIGELQAAITITGSIVSLTDKSFTDLQTAATNPDALATRYALRELNPFAVLGLDYSRFNRNGELNLFDPATGTGTLTQSWLEDRAKMLVWLVAGNTNDRGYDVTTGGINWQFQDLTSGQAAYALSTANAIGSAQNAGADPGRLAALFRQELALNRGSRVVFGAEAAEIINGGGQTDRLYGGGGDDVLYGYDGSDYLEGDGGDDVLIGGTGNDIYAVGGGTGTDIIVDAAEGAEGRQLGEIRFGDAAVAGTFAALDAELKTFTFTAADGQYYASYTGSVQDNLAGTLTLWRGDSGARVVQVHNFRSGDLGIVLGGGAPPRTYTDIVGTQEADNDKLDISMPHEATLFATAEAQKVFGLGGADHIVLGHAHTLGYGGAGNDRIVDGAGAQSQYGEDGDDVLLASAESKHGLRWSKIANEFIRRAVA